MPFARLRARRAIAVTTVLGATLAASQLVLPSPTPPETEPTPRRVRAAVSAVRPVTGIPGPPTLPARWAPDTGYQLGARGEVALIRAAARPQPAEPRHDHGGAAAPPAGSVWDRLAACESNGDWTISTGTFEGGLQFHPSTWDAHKDPGMADAAYQASRKQQIRIARRVLDSQGWRAWPACSRKLGLR